MIGRKEEMYEKKSILIVDDDHGICRTLSFILNKKGYETETAKTGREAIETVKKKLFNIALLDIKLPDIKGIDLITQLKELQPEIEVMMITAYGTLETAILALNKGAAAYITKPLNMDEVLAIIKKALEKQFLVTEKRRVEKRVVHLNSILRAIRKVNQLITKENNREKLLQGACDNLIETRGYNNAWITLFENSNKVVLTAEASLDENFLPMDEMLKKGELPNCCQMTMTLSDVVITEDPHLSCENCPLSKKCVGKSSMTVRLEHEKKIYGCLTVFIQKMRVEDEEEKKLFKEVADDIAFALHKIELREKREETEQKLIESEKKFRMAYDRANFFKDLFAHDINNILQTIQSSMELLLLYLKNTEINEDINEVTSIIKEQIFRGAKLVSNVRKLSEIEETDIFLESIEACEVLKNVIQYITNSYQKGKIITQINPHDKKFHIKADELLYDVFENILINAVKHNNNPIVEILIKISKEEKNGISRVKLEFIDNGIGIPDKMKDMVFQRAFKKDKSVSGMGLGLSLVKKIIEKYNGEIWVEDKIQGDYSKGSNFIILIPEAT